MGFLTIFTLIAIAVIGYLFFRGFSNTRYKASDTEFSQAGVRINFPEGKITIKGKVYDVKQVTGIKMQSFSDSRRGSSKAQNVIIELDDFSRPQHKVMFVTASQGNQFMQRLSTALRKAGGPNYI